MPLGISFAPGADLPFNGQAGQNGSAPSRLSPQQAVRILSLRVPERLPSNAPVARQLLTSPGGSAAGAPSSLQAMLQQLMARGGQPNQPVLPSRPFPQFPPQQAPTTGGSQGVSQPPFQGELGGYDPSRLFPPYLGGPNPGGNTSPGQQQQNDQMANFFNSLTQFGTSNEVFPRLIVDDTTGPF